MKNQRFAGLEINDVVSAPVVSAPVVSARQNCLDAARQERAAIESEIGLSLQDGEQLYATGTKLASSGLATVIGARAQFDALPSVADGGLTFAVAPIVAEERQDRIARPVVLDGRGQMLGMDLEAHAYRQLAALAPRNSAVPANVNSWLHRTSMDKRIRTRTLPGRERSIFAVLSQRYQDVSALSVARWLEAVAPKSAKVDFKYDVTSTAWTLTLEWAPGFSADEAGVGRVHRIRYTVRGADNGSTPLSVAWQVVRVRCVNATTIQDDKVLVAHRHTKRNLAQIVQEAIQASEQAMHSFSHMWAQASRQAIVDAHDHTPLAPEECFKRLISHDFLTVPDGIDKDIFLAQLVDAYRAESIYGAAGINAAITRAAHSSGYGWQAQQALEDQAGTLLYAQVYEVPSMSSEW